MEPGKENQQKNKEQKQTGVNNEELAKEIPTVTPDQPDVEPISDVETKKQ